jgi:hypothetical protein
MKNKVGGAKPEYVSKDPGVTKNRSVWIKKEEEKKRCKKKIVMSKKNSNEKTNNNIINTNSEKVKYDYAVTKVSSNEADLSKKVSGLKDIKTKEKNKTTSKKLYHWKEVNDPLIPWEPDQSTTRNIESERLTKVQQLKSWFHNNGREKKKYNHYYSKINNKKVSPVTKLSIDTVYKKFEVVPELVDNITELQQWLFKLESKRAYTTEHRKKVRNMASYNKFSVLDTDTEKGLDEEEIDDAKPSATVTTPDIVMNIVQPNTPHTTNVKNPTSNHTKETTSLQTAVNNQGQDDDFTIVINNKKKSSVPPPIPSINNAHYNGNQPQGSGFVETNPWNEVGSRETIRERKYIQEEYSNRFAPMYLPEEPFFDDESELIQAPTSKVLPITIRVTAPVKYKVKNGRVLVAVLRALQKVDPTTYISPISDTFDMENILHPRNVPPDEDSLSYYMEDPNFNRYKNYSSRIYICSNIDLDQYKKNQELIDYFNGASINLEYNDLDSVLPTNIGFLEDMIARPDTVELHKNRIIELLPKGSPRFAMSVQTLHGPDNKSTRVFMLKCDKKHLAELTRLLLDLPNSQVKLFPWNSFSCLSPGQKLTIVNEQIHYATIYRSLILKGFIDRQDDIPMQSNNSSNKFHGVLVTDYLRYHVKTSNNDNMFMYVFPPHGTDTREFLVKIEYFGEATSYLEVVRGELARNMSPESIRAVFDEPHKAIKESGSPQWRAYSRQHLIKTPTTPTNEPDT